MDWNNPIDSELKRRFEELEQKRLLLIARIKARIPAFDDTDLDEIK